MVDIMEYDVTQNAPWRRLFARLFDFYVFSFGIGALLTIISSVYWPPLLSSPLVQNPALSFIFTGYLACVLSGMILGGLTTTPGKYLFGIKVTNFQSEPVGISAGILRDLRVWIQGMWFGIPILYIIAGLRAKSYYEENRATRWDMGRYQVGVRAPGGKRIFLDVIGVILFISLLVLFSWLGTLDY